MRWKKPSYPRVFILIVQISVKDTLRHVSISAEFRNCRNVFTGTEYQAYEEPVVL